MAYNTALSKKETMREKKGCAWLMPVILLLLSFLLFIIIRYCFQERTFTSGSFSEPDRSDSIVCERSGVNYPFFSYDNSDRKETVVNVVFKDSYLDTISFKHLLYYNDVEELKRSESINHADLNLATQGEGLGPDVFTAHYSILADAVQLVLSAKSEEINAKNSKYFLLEGLSNPPYKKDIVWDSYLSNGFICKEVNNNKE